MWKELSQKIDAPVVALYQKGELDECSFHTFLLSNFEGRTVSFWVSFFHSEFQLIDLLSD